MVFGLAVIAMLYVNSIYKEGWSVSLGIYGTVMLTYLLAKMILSFFYRPKIGDPPNLKVSVIIPIYNEKANAIQDTILSILNQDYPIHEIIVVDDGSDDDGCYEEVLRIKEQLNNCKKNVGIEVAGEEDDGKRYKQRFISHRFSENKGKRHAQIWGFERSTGDVIVTVDSDGYLFPDAVRALLIPFRDAEVMAVTGHVNARNRIKNWFTKLIDMRYENAFRVERAAQSVTGNVLICCGPISCYRREVIIENLEQYGHQMFLGEVVQAGDDRCLTNYAILKGKTVYQETARCITDVPTTLVQFIKQQIRWNKSFFRESLLALKIGVQKPIVLIWVVMELALWIVFNITLILGFVIKPLAMGWLMAIYYFACLCLSAYARNVFYILKHPFVFFMAPIYGFINIIVLFPLRIYALCTLKSNKWGTR
ncbi:glycosyltransferase family 2 protein [Bacillus cereus]|nr:glycosyltransferase family 2 protein [Bacillus cereus]